jgi:hypothetical protein
VGGQWRRTADGEGGERVRPPRAVGQFEAIRRWEAELRTIVGDGRPAGEIADVVRELYDHIRADEDKGVRGHSDEFHWRMADSLTRGNIHVTRDGHLHAGGPDG